MTRDFFISFRIEFEEEDMVGFLENLYTHYRGEMFTPVKFDIGNRDEDIDADNFRKLMPYIIDKKRRGANLYSLLLKKGHMLLAFHGEKIRTGSFEYSRRGTVSIETYYMRDKNGTITIEHLVDLTKEFMDFAVLLAKAGNTDRIVGCWEDGDPSPYTARTDFLLIKKNLWKKFMKEHIKIKFDLELSEKEAEKLVKENAVSMEEREGFMLINFSSLRSEVPLYVAIKKIKEAKENGK